MREDVLDAGADLGFLGIGLRCPLRHRLGRWLLAMDPADLASIGQKRLVGG